MSYNLFKKKGNKQAFIATFERQDLLRSYILINSNAIPEDVITLLKDRWVKPEYEAFCYFLVDNDKVEALKYSIAWINKVRILAKECTLKNSSITFSSLQKYYREKGKCEGFDKLLKSMVKVYPTYKFTPVEVTKDEFEYWLNFNM